MADEFCSNCGATIGKLQTAYVFRDQVVCYKCDQLLREVSVAKTQIPEIDMKKIEAIINKMFRVVHVPDDLNAMKNKKYLKTRLHHPKKNKPSRKLTLTKYPGEHGQRHNTIEGKLLDAIQKKTPLEIIYWGGTQPGRKRKIFPVVMEVDKVRAVCMATGETKLYFIDHIKFPEDNNAAPQYVPGLIDHQTEIVNLDVLSQDTLDILSAQGWHVQKTDCNLAIFLYFKNGKLRKTPEVELLYFPDRESLYEESLVTSTRPWYVQGKTTGPARTFKNLFSALEHFLKLAQQMKAAAGASGKGA